MAGARAQSTSEAGPRPLVGTSAWKKKPWRGAFYPSGLAQARELAYLADRLPTVEINATYHGLQQRSSFRSWHDQVPERFVFSVKAYKAITHDRMLRGAEREVAAFFGSGPLLLREKLGPFLWQLPPHFVFDAELLDGFFAALPRSVDEARGFIRRHGGDVDGELAAVPDRPLRHSIEVRSASFAQPRYLELLRRHGVAAVLTNPTDWPVIDAVTADFVYVRLDDTLTRFPGGQTEADLERHATRIRAWLDGSAPGGDGPEGDGTDGSGSDGRGRDVFFYFDDPDYQTGHPSTRPPFDAIALQGLVGGELPAPGATLQASLW